MIECHFCEEEVEESDIVYFSAFAGAERVDANTLNILGAISKEPKDGAVPCCPKCSEELREHSGQTA